MNPVVLIATHDRLKITSLNIKSLLRQSVKPQIVVVTSNREETRSLQRSFPDILITEHPNNPLGRKWQHGVDQAMVFEPDPLIILGSDDLLGKDYIQNVCSLMAQYDFVGLHQWWVYSKGILHLVDYKASIPLGGGRAYSWKLLQSIGKRLFDCSKERHLDDYGYHNASNFKRYSCHDCDQDGLNLVAIKGDWKVMNEFNPNHNNVHIVKSSRLKEDLDRILNIEYEPERVL